MTLESVLREVQVVQKDDGVWVILPGAAANLGSGIAAQQALVWAERQREALRRANTAADEAS